MAETSTGETQSGTSAAKQMLAALTRASQEMTRKFNDSCEQVSRLNATLENKVNERLAELSEHSELIVRSQLEGLIAEKDAILAELTELRREELKVLQSIGQNMREALLSKLKEQLDAVESEMKTSIAAFLEQLEKSENSVSDELTKVSASLSKGLPEQLAKLKKERETERDSIETAHSKQHEQLREKSADGLIKLSEHFTLLKTSLDEEGAAYVSTLDSVMEKLVAEHQAKLKERIDALSEVQERVKQGVGIDRDYLDSMPDKFAESCRNLTSMKLELHATQTNNLALVYRTEIVSIAKQSEDQMMIIRSHLQTLLHNYQDSFNEQAAKLLQKFEKNAREAMPAVDVNKAKSPESEGVPEAVVDFISKMKTEIKSNVKENVSAAKTIMEDSLDEFRSKLNVSSLNYANTIEKSFNDARKDISELTESNKEKIEEMTHKADALEQLVTDARDLLSALD